MVSASAVIHSEWLGVLGTVAFFLAVYLVYFLVVGDAW